MAVEIQVVSDLYQTYHYRFYESDKYTPLTIEPKALYLALLGNVGRVVEQKDAFFTFIRSQLTKFEVMFFVPGNHEAWHSSWAETLESLREFERQTLNDDSLGDFIVMDRRSYQIPGTGVVILGCSLFSYLEPRYHLDFEWAPIDFLTISDWNAEKHNQMHERDLQWLNLEVVKMEWNMVDPKVVILTHWSPSRDPRSIYPPYSFRAVEKTTDLFREICFTSPLVKAWAFGHTDHVCDFMAERDDGAGSLQILSHPHGFDVNQPSAGWDGGKVIHVPSE